MFTVAKDDTARQFKDSARDFKNEAADTIDEVGHDFRDAANKAGRKARTLLNSATDEFTHAKEAVETQIRTKPVQSSMVALGIGFVLGVLFRR